MGHFDEIRFKIFTPSENWTFSKVYIKMNTAFLKSNDFQIIKVPLVINTHPD